MHYDQIGRTREKKRKEKKRRKNKKLKNIESGVALHMIKYML